MEQHESSKRFFYIFGRSVLYFGPAILGLIGLLFSSSLLFRILGLLSPLSSLGQIATPIVAEVRSATLGFFLVSVTLSTLLFLTHLLLQTRTHILVQRRAMETDRSAFVRLAADTLRTPLTGLRWITELFLDKDFGDVTPEQRKGMENMNLSIQRLIALVNELLKVMKLSGGVISYRPILTDINGVIKGSLSDIGTLAAAKDQALGFGVLAEQNMILIDAPLVRHLLDSLLTHAVHLGNIHKPVIVHVEYTPDEMSIGITYTGEKLEFKGLSTDVNTVPGIVRTAGDADEGANLAIAWEILNAAGGRFWVRDQQAPEYTLFTVLPRETAPGAKKKGKKSGTSGPVTPAGATQAEQGIEGLLKTLK